MAPIEAWDEFESHRAALRRTAMRRVHDADAVEDVLQEARIAAWRARLDPRWRKRAWHIAVVRNQALIARRRRNAIRAQETSCFELRDSLDPAEECLRRSVAAFVRRCVAGLDEPYRSVVRMRHLEGLGVAEVSSRLKRPTGTVRSQTKRGLALLRMRLAAELRDERAPPTS